MWSASHSLKHWLWNKCRHGAFVTSSLNSKLLSAHLDRQNAHEFRSKSTNARSKRTISKCTGGFSGLTGRTGGFSGKTGLTGEIRRLSRHKKTVTAAIRMLNRSYTPSIDMDMATGSTQVLSSSVLS